MMTFDNTTLVSHEISEKEHRRDCNTLSDFCGVSMFVPLIASPMPDVCNGLMAATLAELGILGIIHRVQTIEQQVNEFNYAKSQDPVMKYKNIGCAIGVTGDYTQRFIELASLGCRIFCLDTANGANRQVEKAVNTIKMAWTTFKESQTQKIYLIAGNVATIEGYAFLNDIQVDAVRVGIAGGSVCETRTETGIYVPTLQSVVDIARWKEKAAPNGPKIIADGGIKIPGDMSKALVGGADVVMCGGIFAGTKESPGDVLKIDGKLRKLYRGAASYSVQQEAGREEPLYNEGNETLVPYKGEVRKVVDKFRYGLQSSMSYGNAGNLSQFRTNVQLEQL